MKPLTKTAALIVLLLIVVLFSCLKRNSKDEVLYQQDESFFQRDSKLKGLFKQVNGQSGNENLLNTIINEVKASDKLYHNITYLKNKYGRPLGI